jgi:hypothetical protein
LSEAPLVSRRPVTEELLYYFPATFELTTASMILSLVVGTFIGMVSAVHRNRFFDHLTRTYSIFGISMPIFWLGLFLLLLFYVKLGCLPGGGRITDGIEVKSITGLMTLDCLLTGNWMGLGSSLFHLLLPAFCLSIPFPSSTGSPDPGIPPVWEWNWTIRSWKDTRGNPLSWNRLFLKLRRIGAKSHSLSIFKVFAVVRYTRLR